jgi:hypothetical protein
MALDNQTRQEIIFDINRIDEILRVNIFTPKNHHHPLLLSGLTEILIRLRDLLWKSNRFAKPVSFEDDVTIRGKVTDVTSLVVFVRDAVCHIDSANHDHDQAQARVSFNVIFGKGCLFEFGQASIESPYEDDVAFFFGPQRLYLRRHIIRAFEEARDNLLPYLQTLSA